MITIQIDRKDIGAVVRLIRANKVKHMPIIKNGDEYELTMEDNPIISFIQLRFN